jgi:hypothetical protein
VMTTPHGLVFAGVALVVVVASIIYVLFGTFSPVEAKKIYKQHVELQAEYSRLFRQRETLTYHIGWAQVYLFLEIDSRRAACEFNFCNVLDLTINIFICSHVESSKRQKDSTMICRSWMW